MNQRIAMQPKKLLILGWIGIVAGFAATVYGLWNLILDFQAIKRITYVNENVFPNWSLYTSVGLLWSFIAVCLAVAVGIISIICLVKLSKNPAKGYPKLLIIANVVGLISPFFFGSIIILISAALGFKYRK